MSIRTVVITGANRGLGLELAKVYSAKDNTQVIGTARNPKAAIELASLPNVSVVALDVSDLNSIPKLAENISKLAPGGIDILWNNAGQNNNEKIPSEVSPEGFVDALKINVVAQTAVVQALLPLLRKKSTKKIIFMSSLMGSLAAMASAQKALAEGKDWHGPSNKENMVYSTTKTALTMTALSWAGHLKPEGFTVTPIHPGWVKTDMGSQEADITVDVSVKGLYEVVEKLTSQDDVLLRNYDGGILPW